MDDKTKGTEVLDTGNDNFTDTEEGEVITFEQYTEINDTWKSALKDALNKWRKGKGQDGESITVADLNKLVPTASANQMRTVANGTSIAKKTLIYVELFFATRLVEADPRLLPPSVQMNPQKKVTIKPRSISQRDFDTWLDENQSADDAEQFRLWLVENDILKISPKEAHRRIFASILEPSEPTDDIESAVLPNKIESDLLGNFLAAYITQQVDMRLEQIVGQLEVSIRPHIQEEVQKYLDGLDLAKDIAVQPDIDDPEGLYTEVRRCCQLLLKALRPFTGNSSDAATQREILLTILAKQLNEVNWLTHVLLQEQEKDRATLLQSKEVFTNG